MVAGITGTLGLILSWWVGKQWLGLSDGQVGICILASWVASIGALFLILKAERAEFLKKTILSSSWKVWLVFVSSYFGIWLLLAPPLRDSRVFLTLAIPLILNAGWGVMVFGPIQDYFVARRQRLGRR